MTTQLDVLRVKLAALNHVQAAALPYAVDTLMAEIKGLVTQERAACAALCDLERGPVAARLGERIRKRKGLPKR